MTSVPHLVRLARRTAADPERALVELLGLLCEQLGLEHAQVGRRTGDSWTVLLAAGPGGRTPAAEGPRPVDDVWCARVPAGGRLVVPDAAATPSPAAPGCYLGTAVLDRQGQQVAVLGVTGPRPHRTLDDRDLDVLGGLGEVAGELVGALTPAGAVPAQRRPLDVAALAGAVAGAQDLAGLTAPLLAALHDVSGLASTYLTVVHEDAGVQELRYVHNGRDGFALPQGAEVPWDDTLCKRALDEGRTCTADVPAVWGDSDAAAQLGIVTYASVPVRLADGRLWGTLCGADDVAHDDVAEHLPTLTLFARLLATEVERGAALTRAQEEAERARRDADTDALTGCASRRTVLPWLRAQLAAVGPDEVVALVFVDVDGFKQVNDRLGHAAGDALLRDLGTRLQAASRTGDLVARLGGDELLVAARLPEPGVASLLARVREAGLLAADGPDGPVPVRCATGLATSRQAGDAEALLGLADAAMYRDKAAARR